MSQLDQRFPRLLSGQPLQKLVAESYTLLKQGEVSDVLVAQILSGLSQHELLLYGAGTCGRGMWELCGRLGVPVTAFIDQNFREIESIDDLPVLPVEALSTLRRDGGQPQLLIVCSNTLTTSGFILQEIDRQLDQSLTVLIGYYLAKVLAFYACSSDYSRTGLIDVKKCMDCRADPAQCTIFQWFGEQLGRAQGPAGKGLWSGLNDISYMVTSACTLRCEHCVEKLPDYPLQQNLPLQIILDDISKLLGSCRFIHRFCITGGEPLLHPQLPELLEFLLQAEQVGMIFLYTSGTVVPSSTLLERLENQRVVVNLSSYGARLPARLEENFDRFREQLKGLEIACNIYPHKTWFDMGTYETNSLDARELRAGFAACPFRSCMTIHAGVLYRCPHQLGGGPARRPATGGRRSHSPASVRCRGARHRTRTLLPAGIP